MVPDCPGNVLLNAILQPLGCTFYVPTFYSYNIAFLNFYDVLFSCLFIDIWFLIIILDNTTTHLIKELF